MFTFEHTSSSRNLATLRGYGTSCGPDQLEGSHGTAASDNRAANHLAVLHTSMTHLVSICFTDVIELEVNLGTSIGSMSEC